MKTQMSAQLTAAMLTTRIDLASRHLNCCCDVLTKLLMAGSETAGFLSLVCDDKDVAIEIAVCVK